MSTPTDQFSSLSLDSHRPLGSQMAPTSEEVAERAVELQDIISSFDNRDFPSEFRLPIIQNIDRPSNLRLRSEEWTVAGDLPGSLLYWGAYDDKTWEVLNRIQDPAMRARAFYEKLYRRFTECFERYDAIDEPSTGTALRAEIDEVADELRYICEAVRKDRERRVQGEFETLEVVLGAFSKVCQRCDNKLPAAPSSQSPPGTRRSARLSQTDFGTSLYEVLIRNPSSSVKGDKFMLAALESFSSGALKHFEDSLVGLNGNLHELGAPQDYVTRFEGLQEKANEIAPPTTPTSQRKQPKSEPESSSRAAATGTEGESRARKGGPDTDTRTGTKRPAAETPGRGRKRAGKP